MNMNARRRDFPRVLAVDRAGRPIEWLGLRDTVHYYVLGQVAWTVGDVTAVVRGGVDRRGRHTQLEVHAVIAVRGADAERLYGHVPALTNNALFARDGYRCMYCGERYAKGYLSRDHVVPKALGGPDTWENCLTACLVCNNHKADRTPEQAGMAPLALPYAPNHAEALLLANRRVLADQMHFLSAQMPRHRQMEWSQYEP